MREMGEGSGARVSVAMSNHVTEGHLEGGGSGREGGGTEEGKGVSPEHGTRDELHP